MKLEEEEELLYKWAQKLSIEANFFSQVSLSKDHLAMLLKVKKFPQIARELIRHVRTPEECHQIRLNLRHSALRKSDHGEEASCKSQVPSVALRASLDTTKEEISREVQELKQLAEENEELLHQEEGFRRQITLMDVAIEDRDQKTKDLNQLIKEVDSLIPQYLQPSMWEEESMQQELANDDVECVLGRLKEVKLCHLCPEDDLAEAEKSELWHLTESLLKNHHPSSVLKALLFVTQKDTAALNGVIERIDLIADAKALRLKYLRDGGLVDELCPEVVLETVESMLVEMSAKHVKAHFRNQRQLQEIHTAEECLKSFVDWVHSTAQMLYGDTNVSDLMVLFEATLAISGLKAVLSVAPKLIEDLRMRRESASQHSEAMLEKYGKINHFDEQVVRLVSDLQYLSLEASHHVEHIERKKKEITALVEEGSGSLPIPMSLKGSFSKEVEAVLKIPMDALRCTTTEAGIIPVFPVAPAGHGESSVKGLKAAVSYVTTCEHLIEIVRQKKLRLNQCKVSVAQKMDQLAQVSSNVKEHHLSSDQIKELCQKAQSEDLLLETQLLPTLDQCEKLHHEMEGQVVDLRNTIDEWWNQPGSIIRDYLKC